MSTVLVFFKYLYKESRWFRYLIHFIIIFYACNVISKARAQWNAETWIQFPTIFMQTYKCMYVKYFVYSTHYACMNSIKHYADDDGDVVFVMMIFDIPLPLQFFLLLAFESTQESCSVLCFMRHYWRIFYLSSFYMLSVVFALNFSTFQKEKQKQKMNTYQHQCPNPLHKFSQYFSVIFSNARTLIFRWKQQFDFVDLVCCVSCAMHITGLWVFLDKIAGSYSNQRYTHKNFSLHP